MKQQEREVNRDRRGKQRSRVTKEPLANVRFSPLLRSVKDSISLCVCVCVAQIPAVYQFHTGDEGLSGQLCVSAPVYLCGCVYLFVTLFICRAANVCRLAGERF